MISEADAVVVGAGALGLSTAFHLARFGVRRVALVDRFAPGSQTSARAAGLFKLVQADETRTRLARLSVQKVTRFMEETGVPLEVVRSGSLLVSRTPEHAVLVREEARQSQAWGVDVQLVDGDEAHRLMPLLEGQGIRAACHTQATSTSTSRRACSRRIWRPAAARASPSFQIRPSPVSG